MDKLLGIDYGTKRVGLAVASTPLSEPFRILTGENIIIQIEKIIKELNVTQIVVGISEGKTKQRTREFVEHLHSKVSVPIHIQDETLSSQEARENLIDAKVKKSKKRKPIDHYAAAIILQGYIDQKQPFA